MITFLGILVVLIGLLTILFGVVIGNDPEITMLELARLPLPRVMELFGEGWLYVFVGILVVLIGVLLLFVKTRKQSLIGAGYKRKNVN